MKNIPFVTLRPGPLCFGSAPAVATTNGSEVSRRALRPLLLAALLLPLGLASCQSKEDKAAAQIVDALQTQSESPAEQARIAAQKAAHVLPAGMPAFAIDLRPGVEALLPEEGYLELVSFKGQSVLPVIIGLPPMARIGVKPGYPKVAPGYKIPFEAVLRWKPTGYGKSKPMPAKMIIQTPKDSLLGFSISELNQQYTTVAVRPGEPVTVQGVLYAYTDKDNPNRLVLYPYHNKQVFLLPAK